MKTQARRFLPVVLALAFPASAQTLKAPHPALPQTTVPEALGINIHFTDARKGELEMLKGGGFRVIRMDFAWSSIEKEKGKYDFSDYDRLLKQLEAQKLQPLFILDYANPFYDEGQSPHTEEARQGFAKWAAAATTHFKGHNILWEMFNEPNGFWKPKSDVQSYIKLALATGKAIRAATPNECYLGPGVSGMDFDYLEDCFKAGLLDYWEAVSVHPYRRGDPETVQDEYRRLRLLIESYKPVGKTIPILSGEWGYSSSWADDAQQGRYLPRQWMTNLMNGVPVSIWYDWHDDGTDPKDQEHNFGTTRNAYFEGRTPVYDPKPSYNAARTFSQFFDGFRFNKRLALASPSDYLVLFNKGNEVKLAAWTTGPAHEIHAPVSAGAFKVVGYLGEAQPQSMATLVGLKLRISADPLYLQPLKSNAVLNQAAKWPTQPLEKLVTAPTTVSTGTGAASIQLERDSHPVAMRTTLKAGAFTLAQVTQAVVANPLSFILEPGVDGALQVRVQNTYGLPVQGQVSLNGATPQALKIERGERSKTMTFPLPQADAAGQWQAKVRFVGGAANDTLETTLHFVPAFQFATFTPENLGASLVANPDGNPAIESEQTLSLEKNGTPAAPDGGSVLKLKYRFAPGWKFVNIQPKNDAVAKIEGRPKSLGMWIYGDGAGNLARIRFSDTTGQTFQPNGVNINWQGWRYVTFPFETTSGRWGGANDGIIHGDLKTETVVLIDSAQPNGSEGEIYFASPSWIY